MSMYLVDFHVCDGLNCWYLSPLIVDSLTV